MLAELVHGLTKRVLPSDDNLILLNFYVTVKAAPHECVIRTGLL